MDRKRKQLPIRELIGFILLVVLLIMGLLSSFWITRHHQAMAKQMEDAAWYGLSQDWEQAKKVSADVMTQWQRKRNLCAVFADHTPMGEIDALFAQLRIYTAAKDSLQFAAACSALSENLEAMADAHRLSWWNLL